MSKHDRILISVLILCGALMFSGVAVGAKKEKKENSCVQCHSRLPTSNFLGVKSHSWAGSVHQKNEVTCDQCHGGNPAAAKEKEAHAGVLGSRDPQSRVYYKNIPTTCGKCHDAEFSKFSESQHYRMLETSGQGPECVTCHGSMVISILTPDNIIPVCERCHNDGMAIQPYIPQKAKAVLLLLQESKALLDANEKLYHPAEGSVEARHMRDARTSLHSAKMEWHKFDLDKITGHLQEMYNSLETIRNR